MDKAYKQVQELNRAIGCPEPPRPQIPDNHPLRLALIREEMDELEHAVKHEDVVEMADALADLIYVTIGMALEGGIPLPAIFDEVHRSNMTKVENVTFRADGKLLKSPDFEPPRIKEILE